MSSRVDFRPPVRWLAVAVALLGSEHAAADEGGVSFWLPGQYSSFAAMPSNPGLSFETVYYRQSPSAHAGINFVRGGGH